MRATGKLPSLGHITLDGMATGYNEQALGLMDGGVDVLLPAAKYFVAWNVH
jgi:methionine synthase I (cobalamin-dependent)